MSREQGPRAAGMRPTASAAGRRQWQCSNRNDRPEAAESGTGSNMGSDGAYSKLAPQPPMILESGDVK